MPASVERSMITSDATQSRADATVTEIASSLRSSPWRWCGRFRKTPSGCVRKVWFRSD